LVVESVEQCRRSGSLGRAAKRLADLEIKVRGGLWRRRKAIWSRAAGDGNEMYDMCAQNRIQGLKMSFGGEPSLPNASLFLLFFLLGVAICAAGRENEAMGELWWSNQEKEIIEATTATATAQRSTTKGGRGKG